MVHQNQFLKNCVHFSILGSSHRSCKPLYILYFRCDLRCGLRQAPSQVNSNSSNKQQQQQAIHCRDKLDNYSLPTVTPTCMFMLSGAVARSLSAAAPTAPLLLNLQSFCFLPLTCYSPWRGASTIEKRIKFCAEMVKRAASHHHLGRRCCVCLLSRHLLLAAYTYKGQTEILVF